MSVHKSFILVAIFILPGFFPASVIGQKHTRKALKYMLWERDRYDDGLSQLEEAQDANEPQNVPVAFNYAYGIYHLMHSQDTAQAFAYFSFAQKTYRPSTIYKKDGRILEKYNIDQRRINAMVKACEGHYQGVIITRQHTTNRLIRDLKALNADLLSANRKVVDVQRKMRRLGDRLAHNVRLRISVQSDKNEIEQAFRFLQYEVEEGLRDIRDMDSVPPNYDLRIERDSPINGQEQVSAHFDISQDTSIQKHNLFGFDLGIYRDSIIETYIARFVEFTCRSIDSIRKSGVQAILASSVYGEADSVPVSDSLTYQGEWGPLLDIPFKIIDPTDSSTFQTTISLNPRQSIGTNNILAFLRAYGAFRAVDSVLNAFPNLRREPLVLKGMASNKGGGKFRRVQVELKFAMDIKEILADLIAIEASIKQNAADIDEKVKAVRDILNGAGIQGKKAQIFQLNREIKALLKDVEREIKRVNQIRQSLFQ